MLNNKIAKKSLAVIALITIAILVNREDMDMFQQYLEHGPIGFRKSEIVKLAKGPSPWYVKEKARYTEALSKDRYDVLVLPVAATPDSLDKISRDMMMRYMAHTLRSRTNLSVPDSTWVIRALGDNQREFSAKETEELANKIGVKWIIESRVSRPEGKLQFELHISVKKLQSGVLKKVWEQHAEKSWTGISFSDTKPPEAAFRGNLGEYIAAMNIPLRPAAKPKKFTRTLAYSGKSLDEFIQAGGETPIDQATALQLVASLYPSNSNERDQLWERSLIALENAAPDSEDYRLLEARAEANLYRRPYALKILGEPSNDREQELFWYLMGNLPNVEKYTNKFGSPIDTIIGLVDSDKIRFYIHREENYSGRRQKAMDLVPKWKEVVASRLSSIEWFDSSIQYFTFQELAKKYPVEPDLVSQVKTLKNIVFYKLGIPVKQEHKEMLEFIQPLQQKLWQHSGSDWASTNGDARLREWDYLDLLFTDSRFAAIEGFNSTYEYQVLIDRAKEIASSLGKVLTGYPAFELERAKLARQVAEQENSNPRKNRDLLVQASNYALRVNRWSGGETDDNYYAEEILIKSGGYPRYTPYQDEPPRYYRDMNKTERQYPGHFDPKVEEWARFNKYAIYDYFPLTYEAWLMGKKNKSQAEKLVAENENRFVGSKFWSNQLEEKYRNRPRREYISALQTALKQDPDNLWITGQLINSYLQDKKYNKVAETTRASILYRYKDESPVEKSVRIENIARKLDQAGQTGLAIPLYEKSMSFDTGAQAEYYAEERVAVLHEDYRAATRAVIKSIERYDSYDDKVDYARYSFILGDANNAMTMLDNIARNSKDINKYIPVFVARTGFRINKFSRQKVMNWLLEKAGQADSYDKKFVLVSIYFLTFMEDETPTDQDLANMETLNKQLLGSRNYFQSYKGYTYYQRHECDQADTPLMKGSKMDLYTGPYNASWFYRLSCALQSGDMNKAKAMLGNTGVPNDKGRELGEALKNAYDGKHRKAINLLKDVASENDFFSVGTEMKYPARAVYAAELLYAKYGRPEYKKLILDITRAETRKSIGSWAGLIEAQYDPRLQQDTRFIARAIYLNPGSHRIQKLKRSAVEKARRWLELNKPFS